MSTGSSRIKNNNDAGSSSKGTWDEELSTKD
jgi:hypothetical protein